MMRKISALLLLLTGLLLQGCNNSGPTGAHTKVTLRQEYFANASYVGEVVATNETASKNGLDLTLIEGSDEIDPIKMVISGQDKFGVAGADRIFTANQSGADLVVLGVVNYINPTVFLAKEELGIRTPKDFEGHKVGVITGNNTEMIYRTLVKRANIDPKKIKEVEIPFDLATFITGAYDIRPAYIFDETVSLDKANIKYTIVKPQDYGVQFIGTVYFTKRETVRNEPELVQKFVNSIAAGWESAIQNPEKALSFLGSYNKTIDVSRERLSFSKGVDYFKGENDKVLMVSKDRWIQMGNALKELGLIKEVNTNFIDNTFIEKYHNIKGK